MRKAISRQRSAGSRRGRKGIVTTKREPAWRRDLRAGWKWLKHQAVNLLAAAGFIWVLTLLAKIFGGG